MKQKTNHMVWIVGIVGVVIVAVILAATVALFVEGPSPSGPDWKYITLDTENFDSNGSDSLTIVHKSGDNASVHNLTVIICNASNGRTGEPYAAINGRHNLTSLGYESGSYLTPNDTITLNRSTLGVEDEINFKTADVFVRYTRLHMGEESKVTTYNWNGSEATTPD
ncbi:type IV pilin [Halapricum hydrolyticum]|uniref:Type IV pilin n=1 Tax=Halapricum hydrolyticum TaxID=2979991 RepID=A0AAE3LH68_9EURY|nr:type IV pilin [Halapricum hydrolyticum]MCU4717480.1 type IV pilin [Halapricum hydrolyticum]MCU4726644.1 type IV pilin [Halapricum hydrolyticum]